MDVHHNLIQEVEVAYCLCVLLIAYCLLLAGYSYDGEVLARRSVKMFALLADTVIFFNVSDR